MNAVQAAKFEKLNSENEHLKSSVDSLKNEVAFLKEQITWFKKQIFGKKSEKIIKDLNNPEVNYLPGFKEWLENNKPEENNEKKTVEAHERRKSKRDGKDKI